LICPLPLAAIPGEAGGREVPVLTAMRGEAGGGRELPVLTAMRGEAGGALELLAIGLAVTPGDAGVSG
jgi:hypothetical protein